MPKPEKCERAPLLKPFTTMETLAVAMVIRGESYKQIWTKLHIARSTLMGHFHNASKKIPGNLPRMMKIHFWGRGARVDQLTGNGWMPEPPNRDIPDASESPHRQIHRKAKRKMRG